MRTHVSLVFVAAFVCSCQGTGGALTENSTSPPVTSSAASAIAGDMAGRLAEQIGKPETTTIRLDTEKTDYAIALEAAFKGWGYRVVAEGTTDGPQKPIDVSCALDSFDGQLLASLSTSAIALARTYAVTSAGATPSSPLSIMRRN